MKWTKEQVSILIENYKQHENLYDTEHPHYFDRLQRENSIDSICNELKKLDETITPSAVTTKVHSLRSQYGKELKAVQNNKRAPRLWFFNKIDFLRPLYIRKVQSRLNNGSSEEEYEDDDYDDDSQEDGHGRTHPYITRERIWTPEITKILIEKYKEHPQLYDVSDPAYRDSDLRKHILVDICEDVRKFMPNITVDDIKNKLHSLRSLYGAALRRMERRRLKGLPVVEPTLWCYNLLHFLKPHIMSVQLKVSNSYSTHLSEISADSDTSSNESPAKKLNFNNDKHCDELGDDYLQQGPSKRAKICKDVETPKSLAKKPENLHQGHNEKSDGDDYVDTYDEETLVDYAPKKNNCSIFSASRAQYESSDDTTQIKNPCPITVANAKFKHETEVHTTNKRISPIPVTDTKDKSKTKVNSTNERIRKIELDKKLLSPKLLDDYSSYYWLGNQVAFEIKSLKNESIRRDAIERIQKVLHEAYRHDTTSCPDPLTTNTRKRKR
ncbi:uncharacterized protein LOC101887722 isoform X2 [Musca domestica]|uniref:Uncharacterized protein LOC101887722 isoform X2 n=1 Tax=Musca domestica TaxID=7370 RepID=A0A1I8M0U0_MUSDO|nr:uncharacterized protein LOC101887722 isoform X2 [Musca domestica]